MVRTLVFMLSLPIQLLPWLAKNNKSVYFYNSIPASSTDITNARSKLRAYDSVVKQRLQSIIIQ
jgi:hypothetical protein